MNLPYLCILTTWSAIFRSFSTSTVSSIMNSKSNLHGNQRLKPVWNNQQINNQTNIIEKDTNRIKQNKRRFSRNKKQVRPWLSERKNGSLRSVAQKTLWHMNCHYLVLRSRIRIRLYPANDLFCRSILLLLTWTIGSPGARCSPWETCTGCSDHTRGWRRPARCNVRSTAREYQPWRWWHGPVP